ncbi:hypothetical protein AAY473_035060, partial [Plecturocebus cupreus]
MLKNGWLHEMGHVSQAGLELLTSGDPPALAPQKARITGVSHHARPPFLIILSNASRIPPVTTYFLSHERILFAFLIVITILKYTAYFSVHFQRLGALSFHFCVQHLIQRKNTRARGANCHYECSIARHEKPCELLHVAWLLLTSPVAFPTTLLS